MGFVVIWFCGSFSILVFFPYIMLTWLFVDVLVVQKIVLSFNTLFQIAFEGVQNFDSEKIVWVSFSASALFYLCVILYAALRFKQWRNSD